MLAQAGSQIEILGFHARLRIAVQRYFWDRKTGVTQWEHPGCQVPETVSA